MRHGGGAVWNVWVGVWEVGVGWRAELSSLCLWLSGSVAPATLYTESRGLRPAVALMLSVNSHMHGIYTRCNNLTAATVFY